jgi:hypothetical protein
VNPASFKTGVLPKAFNGCYVDVNIQAWSSFRSPSGRTPKSGLCSCVSISKAYAPLAAVHEVL